MSDENVAALKEAFARFEREGSPPFGMFAPDVELTNFDSFPVTRPYHGHGGMVQWLTDMSEPFEGFRFELVDVLAHDDDHVVTTCRATGESKSGGPPFELLWGTVWTFRDGRIAKAESSRTGDEALEAAGLLE